MPTFTSTIDNGALATEVLDRADQQQGHQKTMVSTRRGVEVVTVNKEEMEALRKAAKDDAKKKRELEKMAQEQKRLQQELEKMQSALEAAKEREKNAATMALAVPTNRKIKKENLNDDLVQHTMAAAKTFLFCQTKFVEDIFQERELAEDIIPHLAVDLPISKEEFIDDYSGIVYNCNTPLLPRVKSRTANNCASLSGRHTAVHVS